MYDAICQNKADQLFTLFLLFFYYLHLMAKKQTILYMLVILQHKCKGKTALDVFVGNHLDLLAPPLFGKGLFALSGWWLGTMYMYRIMYTTKYVQMPISEDQCIWVCGFFFLVNWANIIPQKVLFSQFHKL